MLMWHHLVHPFRQAHLTEQQAAGVLLHLCCAGRLARLWPGPDQCLALGLAAAASVTLWDYLPPAERLICVAKLLMTGSAS